MKRFKTALCGGTFDYLHKGHKQFLQFIGQHADRILIGLTSDQYVASFKNLHGVRSYGIRKKELEEFVHNSLSGVLVDVEAIHDTYGSTVHSSFTAGAIFVTDETKRGAELINKKRKEKGLREFEIIEFPLVLTEDSKPISSTRIRNGEISRDGVVYLKEEFLEKNLILPQNLRVELQKPFGELIIDFDTWLSEHTIHPKRSITVGDIITKTLNEAGYKEKVSIVDFYVERKEQFKSFLELGFQHNIVSYHVDNKAGSLSSSLLKTTKRIFQSKRGETVVLKVNGEEDLAVIPAVLAAPLGFTLFYGQSGKGVVKVDITESTKEKVYSIICRFESSL